MKLKIIDENNFLLFIINHKMIPSLKDEKELSEYLKKIFLNIKSKYDLDVFGYYNVNIYMDNNYGMIIKLMKENNEYLNYYSKQIEMKIIIEDNCDFLYKIIDLDDLKNILMSKSILYKYKDILYLEIGKHDFLTLGKLLEYTEIVFENVEIIKKYGERIEIR